MARVEQPVTGRCGGGLTVGPRCARLGANRAVDPYEPDCDEYREQRRERAERERDWRQWYAELAEPETQDGGYDA